MTFNEFCVDMRVTSAERSKLVEFLAIFRAIRTVRALSSKQRSGE